MNLLVTIMWSLRSIAPQALNVFRLFVESGTPGLGAAFTALYLSKHEVFH